MPDLERLRWIAETEFLSLVRSTTLVRDKLRVVLTDGSYLDFWWSTQIPGRYAYHWERRHIDGTIYRTPPTSRRPGRCSQRSHELGHRINGSQRLSGGWHERAHGD